LTDERHRVAVLFPPETFVNLAHVWALSLGVRPDEPGLVCSDDGLDAVAKVELAEDVADVGLDGFVGDDESCSVWGPKTRLRRDSVCRVRAAPGR
jgi:hypothetical protein